jgi:SAM-dependent methyltransferase
LTVAVASERRLSFGGVAQLYDRARPSYPEALVDDVLAFAGAGDGDRAVEVGAGTGKATVLFARRGLALTALEPDPAMAAIAAANLASFPQVAIEQVEFERWRPGGDCKLLYSAQAWHWVRPEMRYVHARRALVDGGAVAAFWNRPQFAETAVQEELERAYEEFGPQLDPPGPMHPSNFASDWMTEVDAELAQAAGLGELETREYRFTAHYTTAQYLDVLQTHSDHITLAPDRRAALLDAIAVIIDRHGGSFQLPHVCRLALARAVARS